MSDKIGHRINCTSVSHSSNQ